MIDKDVNGLLEFDAFVVVRENTLEIVLNCIELWLVTRVSLPESWGREGNNEGDDDDHLYTSTYTTLGEK